MKRMLLALALLAGAMLMAADVKVTVDASVTKTGLEKLMDGAKHVSDCWTGAGPQTLVFTISPAQPIAAVRMYPGNRFYYALPSTDGAPKRVRISRMAGGKAVGQPKEFTMERIPQDVEDANVLLVMDDAVPVDQLSIELLETHDGGFRMHSPNTPVVPIDKRCYSIREIQLVDKAEYDALLAQREGAADAAKALVDYYDLLTRTDGILENALAKGYSRRFEALRDMLESRKEVDKKVLLQEVAWLSGQVLPYKGASLGQSDDATAPLSISLVAQSKVAGEVVSFPLNYTVLDGVCARKLSRFNVSIYAVDASGATRLNANLEHITPDRSRLSWATVSGAQSYRIDIAVQTVEDSPLPDKLVGCGDHLKLEDFGACTLPTNSWSVRAADVFGDEAPALVLGRWTDFIHIYRNSGTAKKFAFREAEHYILRDPFDNMVGVSQHHGHAFSTAEVVDFDGDGKLDVFASCFSNVTPYFLHNVSDAPNGLDFASQVSAKSLKAGWRYAYGDLDGDGIADAVGARVRKNAHIDAVFCKGQGLSADGVPQFQAAKPLGVAFPDSTCIARSSSSHTIAITLCDLNKDGLLDLSLLSAPAIYVCHNDGTKEAWHFKAPERLMRADGKPFETTYYYPNLGWLDANGDGIPDLTRRTITQLAYGTDDKPTVEARLTRQPWCTEQTYLPYADLGGFQMLDFDGDGDLEFCQQAYRKMTLTVSKYKDGLFQKVRSIPLGNPNRQGYGCPDTTEYGNYYSQICMDDFDGDGKPDVLLNNEHNWRFGYYSYFRNLGDGTFGPEEKVLPKKVDYMKFVDSPEGKALEVTDTSMLDYLTLDTREAFDGKNGGITFTFAAKDAKLPSVARVFFSSTYWNKKRWSASQLREVYYKTKTMVDFFKQNPGFALAQLPDGRIALQVNDRIVYSNGPVELRPGVWHRFLVEWKDGSTCVYMDDEPIASDKSMPTLAEKLHIGSQAWMAVQHEREYPSRYAAHPVDFSCPAQGYFESFCTLNSLGIPTKNMDFEDEEGMGGLQDRAALVYRCAPDVVTYNGGPALVAHFDDPYRDREGRAMNPPIARLYVVPFQRTVGEAPSFGEPVPLSLTDGKPFYSYTRTVITACDWNKDGATDLILSSVNFRNDFHMGVELFLNDGNWKFSRAKDQEIIRLNELLMAHHDIKLVLCDLFKTGEEDFFVWTDPGLRAYRRAFLRQKEVPVLVKSVTVK